MQALYRSKTWLTEARIVQGRTLQSIGDEFGISREAVRQWCVKLDIPSRRELSPIAGFGTLLEYVRNRRSRGWTIQRIAAESGRNAQTISKRVRVSGVDIYAVRFYLRVDSTSDGCWEWQGYRDPNGYGVVRWHGRRSNTHRVAWELAFGKVPGEMFVLHKCDNPACCRPDHLFLGTQTDNMRDRDMKGRGTGGLVPYDVISIRSKLQAGIAVEKIALEFNVHTRTIQDIRARRSWDWLKSDELEDLL